MILFSGGIDCSFIERGIAFPRTTKERQKPMHMQPMYRMHECIGREGSIRCRTNAYIAGDVMDVGADVFDRGCCLPSDNKMTAEQQDKIIQAIRDCFA